MTSSAPFDVVATVGVPHDGSSSRSVFQTTRPVRGVERHEERVRLRVALQDHEIVPDDRRARGAPLEGRDVVGADVEAAEIGLPQQRAVDAVGVDALRAERGDDEPAVRRRRGAGVGRLDVAQLARRALEGDALPDDLSRRRVEREQRPPLRRAIGRRIAVAVESGPERRLRIAADGARHEHAIAPHDRARVREAGDRRPPAHVLARLRVPGVRQLLAVRHTGRLGAAERRPAARGGRERLRGRPGQRA